MSELERLTLTESAQPPVPAACEALLGGAWDDMVQGHYAASVAKAREVREAREATPGQRGRASLLLAYNASNQGAHADGLQHARQAIADACAVADEETQAKALVVHGDCLAGLEQIGPAMEALRSALALSNDRMSVESRRLIYTGVGLSYRSLGLSALAVEAQRNALNLITGQDPRGIWVRAWTNLANAIADEHHSLSQVEPSAAAALLQEGLSMRSELLLATADPAMRRSRIAVHVSLTRLLLAAGRLDEARQALHEALEIAPDIDWRYRRDWWIDLAWTERGRGDAEAAQRATASARQLVDTHPVERLSIHAVRRMAELATLEGKAEQTWQWSREFLARVLRSEHAALTARVDELAVAVRQSVLRLELADLRKERADLQDSYQRVHALSRLDPLTKLLNRRALQSEFELHAHTRLYVGLFDLDHFKQVNDRFGHPVGDAVLQKVAAIFGAQLRRNDRVGRFGGEEFLVLLSDMDDQGVCTALKRIRESVARLAWSSVAEGLTVTVSGGVVARQADERFESAVARADALLYRAKAAGRNRVILGEGAAGLEI